MLLHDILQPGIHLLAGPAQPHAVLGHFQTRYGHAAGIGCLARCIKNFFVNEQIHRLGHRRHVGAFAHQLDAVVG